MPLMFLAPQFLWALLALPLVIVLHYVRARKRRYEVSALFLWHRAKNLAQRRRRFSPTWLLIMQLLFVTLAALALARPTITRAALPDRVIVMDASASMLAREGTGTRFSEGLERAEGLLNGAGRVAVIRAGLDATVVQPFDEPARARESLRNMAVGDERADLRRALELAASLAPEGELHLISDSARPAGIAATVHPVGTDALNLGISAFELRHNQAFVSVVSSNPRPQEVPLTLYRGETVVAQSSLLVPANGQANASFPVDTAPGFYRAVLDTPDWDALELDNVAYAGNRELRVLLTPPSATLERALRVIPGAQVRAVQTPPISDATYDVLVQVGALPATLAPGRYIFIEPPREGVVYRELADWDRADDLLRFVDLTRVSVGLSDAAAPPPEGAQVLAQTATLEPLILRWRTPDADALIFRFHPSQSDIIRRPAFPILMTNVLETFRREDRLTMGSPTPAGARVLLNGTPYDARHLVQPGVYTVDGVSYALSLLNAETSRLRVTAEAATVERNPLAPETERGMGLGLWLTLFALLALVAEWLLFTRRERYA